MNKRALVVFTHGVEDVEVVAPIDVLTRCGVEVVRASLEGGLVDGAYGNTIASDTTVVSIAEELFDAVIVPGGAKSAEGLAADSSVVKLIRRHHEAGKLIASLCASPGAVLAEAAGLLAGRRATGDPGFNHKLAACGAIVTDEDLTIDGEFITARGPGAALAFGLAVATALVGPEVPGKLAERWRL